MTLQIQAETLGRADQEKKVELRKAKYRSQDLSGAEKQKSEGSPRSNLVSSYLADSPATTQDQRPPLFPTKPESSRYASCDLVFGSKSTMNGGAHGSTPVVTVPVPHCSTG